MKTSFIQKVKNHFEKSECGTKALNIVIESRSRFPDLWVITDQWFSMNACFTLNHVVGVFCREDGKLNEYELKKAQMIAKNWGIPCKLAYKENGELKTKLISYKDTLKRKVSRIKCNLYEVVE